MAAKASINRIQIGKSRKYPVKKTINLMYKEKTKSDIAFTLFIFMLYLVALYFFSKYGVNAQLKKADDAENYYKQKLDELHALQAENNEFGNVITEYSHYGNGFLTEGELASQDRITMLNIIDQRIHTTGGIQNIKISDNVAKINLGVSEAELIPEIIKQLEESEYVSYVTAQTANTVDKRNNVDVVVDSEGNVLTPLYVDASITVNFRTPQEVEDAISGGEVPKDTYLDASATGFATGDNVYVPTIIETAADDSEAAIEANAEANKEDKSQKDSKSTSSSGSKSSSGSSSSTKAQAKAKAAQQAAQAQAQAQAAARQREAQAQAAAQQQASAQAAAQQKAAAQAAAAGNQTVTIDTDTSQFGGAVNIQGGSPFSGSSSPMSAAGTSFGPSAP